MQRTFYFRKIKCALHESIKDRILANSPADLINPIKVPQKEREYLTIDEIQNIADTPFYNVEVKKAFLFSCFTGLRYGDLKSLKWDQIKEVNYNGNGKSYAIQIQQSKTGIVNHIPLNETALKLIGKRPKNDLLVF